MSERREGWSSSAWLVALAGLPGMGPARMRRLLDGRAPEEAWDQARFGALGVPADLARRWVRAARATDIEAVWARHEAAGVRVLAPGDPDWPVRFLDDPEPPAVLFARGTPAVVGGPCVAVVGTRRCTAGGRAVAHDLGRELAEAGVCVVSGLALGIDAAAHRGALGAVVGSGRPAAVVGTGLDVVYPRRNRDLWDAVAEGGAVLSEYPLGTGPERWRFPARNRLIAAVADVVVVVESDVTGGSMHTVDAALERDRTVMAVPGPVRSRASAGTNALLAAGAPVARDAADVLVVLGLGSAGRPRAPEEVPAGDAGLVLDALGWEAATLEQLADRLATPLGPVAVVLVQLEREGWVGQRAGWYERLR